MSKFLKTVAAAAAALATALPAVAATTIDGVTFNPGEQFISTTLWEKVLNSSTDSLEGVGVVNKISCSGCGGVTWQDGNNDTQLTYYFSGFTVSEWLDGSGTWHAAGDEGMGPNSFANARSLVFTGGSIKMYTDRVSTGTYLDPSSAPNAVNPAQQLLDKAAATDGTLWLNYGGKVTFDVLSGKFGTLFASTNTANSVHAGGAGYGYMDVLGGAAATPFNTNSYNVFGVIADARFDSSYSNTNAGAWDLSGTAALKTTAIPEPASLALVGLALVAVGASAARRRKA